MGLSGKCQWICLPVLLLWIFGSVAEAVTLDPVALNDPANVRFSSLTLTWDATTTTDNDFLCYKISRSTQANFTIIPTIGTTGILLLIFMLAFAAYRRLMVIGGITMFLLVFAVYGPVHAIATDPWISDCITPKSTITYTDTGLDGSTTYYYKVYVMGTDGTALASNEVSATTPAEGCDSQTEIKVLFIGNSYTSVNDLPNMVKDLACSGGYNLSVASSTPGGYRFLNHAGNTDTLTAIDSQQWDYVILQNQSQVPGWKPADVTTYSTPYAGILVDAISANNPGTQIIYYVTWGRENGDTVNCGYYSNVCTFTGHTAALLEGYTLYQTATGGTLAKTGTAWEAVVDDGSAPFDSGELWQSDGSHPELLGSYLTATTIYATLFNESPVNLDVPNGISSDNGLYLQQIAQSVM